MMIRFTEVRYKNFMSNGAVMTRINLDGTRRTIISGQSGMGKSTICEAIVFALFGKSYRGLNKGQFVNSINGKDCLVEIDFVIGEDTYTVARGIKPNIFTIKKNDVLIEAVAALRDSQEFLETQILKTNFKIFTQVVLMGTSSYVPFMQLKTQDRREVVEKILDIEVISELAQALKVKLSSWKSNNEENQAKIRDLLTKVESENRLILSLTQASNSAIDQKKTQLAQIADRMAELKEEIAAFGDVSTTDLETQLRNLQIQKNTLSQTMASANTRIRASEKKLTFIQSNDTCEYCRQDITHDHKLSMKNSFESECVTEQGILDELSGQIDQLATQIGVLDYALAETRRQAQTVAGLNASLSTLRASGRQIAAEIQKESNSQLAEDIQAAKDRLLEHKVELRLVDARKTELLEEQELLGIAQKLLKDGGIKSQIIRRYIPQINKIMNRYLASLSFNVLFELDEMFEEKIKSRHRDEFSYWSFSMGEQQRINLSMMFTWREISEMKNSLKTNLLFFDEIFDSSLDNAGIDDVLGIFDVLPSHVNVFVISHRGDAFAQNFDRHLTVTKSKGFSVYQET